MRCFLMPRSQHIALIVLACDPFAWLMLYNPQSIFHKRRYVGAPLEALPFVSATSLWHVPLFHDFKAACQFGRACAAHFAQFLNDNPQYVGAATLRAIAADMDFADSAPARGCTIGFFAEIERMMRDTAYSYDVFADL